MKPHPLKREREQRGWSQGRIAQTIGTTIRTVSRWEQGIAQPSPHHREQLCALFGKSAKQLGLALDINEDEMSQEEALLPLEIQPSSPSPSSPSPSSPSPLIQKSFLSRADRGPDRADRGPDRADHGPDDPTIPETLGSHMSLLGRSDLLARVKEQLFEGDNLALTALNGLPGIGKTSLAVAVATDKQVQSRFRDGILWVGLGPHPNVQGQLARWGKLLGIAPKDVENVNSRDSWAQALRAAISMRHLLLVIDDAWSAEDALAFQVGGVYCAHLLTTRLPQVAFAFAELKAIVVPELEDSDGLALLDRFTPQLVLQDPHGARTLVQAVGGLPLALTLMGKYLAAQSFTGQPRRLEAALSQLHDAKHRLHVSIPTALKERSPSLPADIPLSLHATIAISDQRLSSQAHATLCALSVFPPKPNTFSEEAALAVSQQQVEMLDRLWDAGLLESSGPERYTLHQTIADYARLQVQDSSTHCHPSIAQQRLVNYMLHYIQQHEQDYDALEPEACNILAALDIAIKLDMVQQLIEAVTTLVPFMRVRGRSAQIDRYLQAALKAAITLKDSVGQMTILGYLASTAEAQGQSPPAETSSREGPILTGQLENSDGEDREEHRAGKARDLQCSLGGLHLLPEKKDASDERPSAEN